MKRKPKRKNQNLEKWLKIWDYIKPGLFIVLFAALPILMKYTTPLNTNAFNGKPTQSDYDLLQEDLDVLLPIVNQKSPQVMIQEMATLLESRKPASKNSISKITLKNKKIGEKADLAGKNLNIEFDSQTKPLEVEVITDIVN